MLVESLNTPWSARLSAVSVEPKQNSPVRGLPALTVGMRAHAGEAILDAGITRSDQRTRTAHCATDGIAAARPPLLGTLRHVHKALGLIAGESGHRRQVGSGQAQKANP
jgi:hypothetical protein